LQGLTQNAEQIMINWKQLVATTSTQNQPHPDISVHFPAHNTLQAIKTADLSEEKYEHTAKTTHPSSLIEVIIHTETTTLTKARGLYIFHIHIGKL